MLLGTLIVDNYDSYTYNLYQLCCNYYQSRYSIQSNFPVFVIRNDEFSWENIMRNYLSKIHTIILSPGPGNPANAEDFGCCKEILQNVPDIPILGVCLGHQGIGYYLGGKVVRAASIKHGIVDQLTHNDSGIFHGLPSPLKVVRYHSLALSYVDLPSEIVVVGWSKEENGCNEIMAVEHQSRPMWGVQFHPESICTEYGQKMIDNFYKLSEKFYLKRDIILDMPVISEVKDPILIRENYLKVYNSIDFVGNVSTTPENIFMHFFSDSEYSFWLDSSQTSCTQQNRFSYLGDNEAVGGFVIQYYVIPHKVAIKRKGVEDEVIFLSNEVKFEDWIEKYMLPFQNADIEWNGEHKGLKDVANVIPFQFLGGLVGYIGYEMKYSTLFYNHQKSDYLSKTFEDENPTVTFLYANRMIVHDKQTGDFFVVTLSVGDENRSKTCSWGQKAIQELKNMNEYSLKKCNKEYKISSPVTSEDVSMEEFLIDKRKDYLSKIQQCQEYLQEGESYELCLTTELQIPFSINNDPSHLDLDYFLTLRRHNRSPFSAYFHLGDTLSIASSSPERFMQINSKKEVLMKPIKGTRPRASRSKEMSENAWKFEEERIIRELSTNIKERAENLMIVDLIRNDLNVICKPCSVSVPTLMEVETYQTVHQLVTSVKGQLQEKIGPLKAVFSSFPPGSMTGAPKLRSVQLLNLLEKRPRGIYSGVIGYCSWHGESDFSVVIRTAVLHREKKLKEQENWNMIVGSGGAITILSDAEEEMEEVLTKLEPLWKSIKEFICKHKDEKTQKM